MSMSDPISDFLTRIRNGIMANKKWVDVPSSIIKKRISFVLKVHTYLTYLDTVLYQNSTIEEVYITKN